MESGRIPAKRDRRASMYGWWFVCIASGFGLLGLRSILAGGHSWMVVLRFIIAAGFLAFGIGFLKTPSTRQSRRG